MKKTNKQTKSFCLWCWTEFWHESQIPDWAGLFLDQIPHCMVQNFNKMPGVGLGGRRMGGFGIDWYIISSIDLLHAFKIFTLGNI